MTDNKLSTISLTNRNLLKINGAEGVTNLTENDAVIVVAGDNLIIKGEKLKAEKLSVETGELLISGYFISLKFEEKKEKQSFIKKIFK